jgi:hypothetical protein
MIMKLWRKLAKKENAGTDFEKRNGREIRNNLMWSEQMSTVQKKSYPLLDALIQKAGIKFVMTKKQEAKLKEMIAEANKEVANETE